MPRVRAPRLSLGPPESADRAPLSTDNPRHIVLLAEELGALPRKVAVRNPGENSVNVGGILYDHTHEAKNGQWIYTRRDV